MSVAVATECPVCAGMVGVPGDAMMGELLDCDECGSELEVTQLTPAIEVREAPMSAEDWGE
ncbi:MAG: lysine biosynthesis protein LysW [Gemmatimonadetes bacterium]|nr:lysine biosynthesis protein LysW [Gemmatimonadota bacterium]MDA1102568.1 lysine biosynthesis protein LysW [Gemmatimonadota bacterium]